MFYAILSETCRVNWIKFINLFIKYTLETWDLDGPYCTNLGYKLVVMVWKTTWMFLMSIRLDYITRKFQKYVKCKDIDILGGQNHVLYYFIRNMVFKWSILHCSWEQISYNCLENNLNGFQVRKAWSWHQEVAKIRQNARKFTFEEVKIKFCVNLLNFGIYMAHTSKILCTS